MSAEHLPLMCVLIPSHFSLIPIAYGNLKLELVVYMKQLKKYSEDFRGQSHSHPSEGLSGFVILLSFCVC